MGIPFGIVIKKADGHRVKPKIDDEIKIGGESRH